MKKLSPILAGFIVLISFAVLGSLQGEASQQPTRAVALSQQVNDVLGLSHSVVGDVQVLTRSRERLVIGLDLPDSPIVLDLAPYSVRSENFEARAQLEDGSWVELPPEPVRSYRGTVLTDSGSLVAGSILDDGLHARVVLSDGQEYWIEPLSPRIPEATASQHVLYRTEDVLDTGQTCDADLITPIVLPGSFSFDPTRYDTFGTGTIAGSSLVTAELGCDADFEYFSDHGSGTQARIESIINTINLQYASEVGITHEITTILIRTSSNDPYTKKKANQLLNEFRNEWNTNQAGVQRDVAHLFTGRDLAGNTVGIAFVGVVCNLDVAYSLVQSDFNSNFACVTDDSAHELGHNWGANHCSCPSFTMNGSITCSNTFSPTATIPEILAYRDAQSCFGPPPTTGTIAGTVTSSADGSPIGGASVQADTGQSDTTAPDGTYSIAGVPTGSRTVTASASGFDTENTIANVNEDLTTTVDFALNPAPIGSQAIVDCITYRSSGGSNSDRHLFVDVTIVDDSGNPVAGATVSVSIDLDGTLFGTGTATTGSAGQVTFQAKNSPNGCFETDVTNVNASGLSFDGTEPANGFAKGSDASPDPDCRSGSDACGAG